MNPSLSTQWRSRISAQGELTLTLDDVALPEPTADEVIVRVDAAPINPADLGLLFGPADRASLVFEQHDGKPSIRGRVPDSRLATVQARLDQALPLGNEGAGMVIAAGIDAQHLLGRVVALRDRMFTTHRLAKAADCLPMRDGISAEQAAAALINPMTALGMVETLRREGHRGLIHTAAASNLGQMLVKLCLADGIPLINIVRHPEQVDLLRALGATHVLDSSAPGFNTALIDAIEATGATLAFDAIGGGSTADTLLAAMEAALLRTTGGYSRYGSPVHKQVYVYGMLDPSPRVLSGGYGMAWGIGGWLMSWCLASLDEADRQRLRERVIAEIDTTFASQYALRLPLAQALSADAVKVYGTPRTGQKVLLLPNG